MGAHWMIGLCMSLGIASTLVGGVFLAFSDFIMRGLGSADTSAGVEAMQQINRVVYRSVFLTTLLVLVPATIGFAAFGWWTETSRGGLTMLVAAAVIYFVTVFLVTAFGNVPMNEHLDEMTIAESSTEAYWKFYLGRWTIWNHLRTIGCVATGICYFAAAIGLASESN
jgi:uncharacterized membrane protein